MSDPEQDLEAPQCAPDQHQPKTRPTHSSADVERAVRLFRALGDEARLRTLQWLVDNEACVSEIAAAFEEQISTVSHRMRLLRNEGLVARRRDGRHIYYSLADRHVYELVQNALEHVSEDHHHD